MTTTTRPKRRRAPSPISIRVTPDERQILDAAAHEGRFSTVSAYIRSRLFSSVYADELGGRSSERLSAAERQKMLARILGKLGETKALRNLSDLAEAARLGVLPLAPDVLPDIHAACAAIADIRIMLLKALGLKPPGGSDDDPQG